MENAEIVAELNVTVCTDGDNTSVRFTPLGNTRLSIDLLKEIADMINTVEPEFKYQDESGNETDIESEELEELEDLLDGDLEDVLERLLS